MTEEFWKTVTGYDGYQISNLGKVKNKKGRLLSQWVGNNGYYNTCLSKDKTPTKFLLHRLLATEFINNPNNYKYVNHIDGVKTNNSLENLEWCTQAHNANHAFHILKAHSNSICVGAKGSKSMFSKTVFQYSKNGGLINKFGSTREVTRLLGIDYSSISGVCNGKRKTAGGYVWRYE